MSGRTKAMTGRNQWPANANDVPTKPIYTCPSGCGAMSTAPLTPANHPCTAGKVRRR